MKEFKFPLCTIFMKDTGVLIVEAGADTIYEAEQVKEIIQSVKLVTEGRKYLVLVKPGPETSVTFDALRVIHDCDTASYSFAKVYVISTLSQRLMANFFKTYFKFIVPVKFVSNPREGEAWLLKNYRHLLR